MARMQFTEMIRIDPQGFDLAEQLMGQAPKKLRTAIRFSVIDTVKFTDAEITRQICKRYDITPSDLKSKSRRAKMISQQVMPSGESMAGAVKVDSNRFPVMRFNVVPQGVPPQRGIPVKSRQLVSVITVRGGVGMVGHPNVFMAKMQSGHLGVFKRKPDATHRRRADGQNTQLNIEELHMISPSEMIRSKEIRPQLEAAMRAYFEKRFAHHTRGDWIRGG